MSITRTLADRGLIGPPKFVPAAVAYETEMGSVAYGVAQRASDVDVYGFCVPPAELVFPHLTGAIPGFGRQIQRFEQFQKHGIDDPEQGVQWDITIYSIVRFFQLSMENNPNMIEGLFTPQRCVLYATPVGAIARDARRAFLHKGGWHKFKGFAYSQIRKMNVKEPEPDSKRAELVERFGYDTKFAYHAVRLIDEGEQLLRTGDLDLEASKERLLAVRNGEWTKEQVEQYFKTKEQELDALYKTTEAVPHSPDESVIRGVLMSCLEEAWGSVPL
ncbi:MAG: nucleotidyltransferase domain-containing protein [Myxococcota bacterium]